MLKRLMRSLALLAVLFWSLPTQGADEEAPKEKEPKFLDKEHAPKGKGWIDLFNGKNLDGWKKRPGHDREMSWKVVDGVLVNKSGEGQHGVDLVSEKKFDDCEVYYEYKVEPHGNSGMYFRGRYEIQILDDVGREADKGSNGALYSIAAPAKHVSKKAGEWQSVYAKIVGRKVDVWLNGTHVIDGEEATRPTGGELDRDEDKPGPIMLQGDHGSLSFRMFKLRPIEKKKDGEKKE